MFRHTRRAPRIAAGVVLLAGAAVASTALLGSVSANNRSGGDSRHGRTLVLYESKEGATALHLHNGLPTDSFENPTGDSFVFFDPMVTRSGKPAGGVMSTCTTVKGSSNFFESTVTCNFTADVPGGQIMAQGSAVPGKDVLVAITGGTGRYNGAEGIVEGRRQPDGEVINYFRLK